MKKFFKAFCILFTMITLIGGSITAGLLFSNNMLLFNCITNNETALRPVYNATFIGINDYQYREIKLQSINKNTNKCVNSTLKIYQEYDNYIIDLSTSQDGNNTKYKYEGSINKGKIYLTTSNTPSLFKEDAKMIDLLTIAVFDENNEKNQLKTQTTLLSNFISFKEMDMNTFSSTLYNVKPEINIKENYMGVRFFFENNPKNSASYSNTIIIDSNNNVQYLSYQSDDTDVSVSVNNCSNTITIAALGAKY